MRAVHCAESALRTVLSASTILSDTWGPALSMKMRQQLTIDMGTPAVGRRNAAAGSLVRRSCQYRLTLGRHAQERERQSYLRAVNLRELIFMLPSLPLRHADSGSPNLLAHLEQVLSHQAGVAKA